MFLSSVSMNTQFVFHPFAKRHLRVSAITAFHGDDENARNPLKQLDTITPSVTVLLFESDLCQLQSAGVVKSLSVVVFTP